MGIFSKKSSSVTHNYIWAPNTMLSAKFQRKLMSESRENLRTDGRTEGQTLFYRTLLAEAGSPTSKQSLEHFKILNQRLFIHKFCKNSKMLLASSWAIFIRVLLFSSSPRANVSLFEYLCFSFVVIFQFILISTQK